MKRPKVEDEQAECEKLAPAKAPISIHRSPTTLPVASTADAIAEISSQARCEVSVATRAAHR
jgi:hypothetical protein